MADESKPPALAAPTPARRGRFSGLLGEMKPRENRYRDVLLLLAMLLMMWAIAVAYGATRQAKHSVRTAQEATQTAQRALSGVQTGRAVSLSVLCAYGSAIGQAGRDVIAPTKGPGASESPFSRFLEQHGYPPLAARQAQSRAAADLYVRSIAGHVDRELAQRGIDTRVVARLVRKDGTIDCRVLSQIAGVPKPR